MSLNLNGGITEENFDNNLDIWKNVVGEFQIFLSSRDLGNKGWNNNPPFDFTPCFDEKEDCQEEDYYQPMEENDPAENFKEELSPASKQGEPKKVEPEKVEPELKSEKEEAKAELKQEEAKPEDKKEEK